tara:strand:+ start:3395 stop:4021 length:627 start_codon:yes stop_codon:yes gene_type:complete
MPSYSKSLFTNDTILSNTRSLITPITLSFTSAIQSVSTGTSEELAFLTSYYLEIINFIQVNYSSKIASRQYESIPTDYTQFTNLTKTLDEIRSKTNNSSINTLLQIAEDTMRGAFNSLALHGDNLLLQIDKADLQKKVDEIITDKNVETTQSTISTSSITVTQTFQLAAVFNYYIRIYGAPQPGDGFDPVKIAFLIYTLQENGIDPYS